MNQDKQLNGFQGWMVQSNLKAIEGETCADREYRCCDLTPRPIDPTPEEESAWYRRHGAIYYAAHCRAGGYPSVADGILEAVGL